MMFSIAISNVMAVITPPIINSITPNMKKKIDFALANSGPTEDL